MASPPQRRHHPLPLVFSPELGPSPPPTVLFSNATAAPPHLSISGSNQNTVSMPFVRRHVTRRLKAAKSECDKELHRITNNITTFFEERLRESQEQEVEREIFELERDRARESPGILPENERDPFSPGNWLPDQSALQTDDSSDGGCEGEVDFSRHGRQPSNSSLSPASLRRSHPVPWDPKPMNSSPSSAGSSMVLPDAPITRLRVDPPSVAAPSRSNPGLPSRRLSRSIHVPVRANRSGQSSRSTSRSRSPLPPPSSHASFSEAFAHTAAPPPTSSASNRRSSRVLLDDPIDPIMTALYDLIAVATDITEMSINQLTAQPKICETFVERIQNIGKAWDRHPNWHGRNWYVQVLLAVASLSRVVEWWEAEKQFWNFDDNEEEQDEPLAFVTKQTDEISPRDDLEGGSGDEDSKHRISRTVSQTRRQRDDQLKALTSPPSSSKDHPDLASRASSSKLVPNAESARVLATERLRLQAETAQNQNTVVELSLDGDHIIWVNYAWSVVVGSDADEIPGSRMSYYLHPADINVLRDASEKLQEEDQKSKTIQARFKLQIVPDDDYDLPPGGALYQKMEANGMLMIDRDDGMPSHTMWVVKPIASPKFEPYPSPMVGTPLGSVGASTTDLNHLESLPFPQPISVEPILCRICECQIPQWYFEKHSETCVELHRMEAEIAECTESISELRNSIRALAAKMDSPSPGSTPVYRGMPILSPSSSPGPSSPLHLFKFGKMQKFGLKKMQRRLLDQLDDILQVALEVSIPSLKEDESKEPIERQRLLSPGSERKMTQIRNWSKPIVEDPALMQLVEDTERIMRQKIDNVIRMQNTMRYSEKIWCEWREKVEETLDLDSDSYSGSDEEQAVSESAEPVPHDTLAPPPLEDDHSSTTSEYGFVGEGRSCEPTPLAPSPVPAVENRPASSSGHEHRPSSSGAISARGIHYTRSSTPSSISSPLAYAAPIVASQSPDDLPPPMSLDDDSHMRSCSNPEHKVFVTPPISPMLVAKDVPTVTRENSLGRRHSRRHSVNPLSIGSSSGSNPLSPRQSAAPLSRSTPTSIKDFDIIKPISKGAFGSVFLAKKKVTGDYYAIKVLKKADMISKNQITNVKAERMILMKQAESPFVAKLYFTFQSKENLYLVMEYLNGGDCAALIKSLGSLPEEWTRQYIAEVTLGLEYLHERGIVHRDLKPDNLLIDAHGHLKLTDFGLSRIGLLGRQSRDMVPRRQHFRSRPPSLDSAYMSSPLLHEGGSYFSQRTAFAPRVGNVPHLLSTDDLESIGSETFGGWQSLRGAKPSDSPLQSFASELTNDLRSHSDFAATQDGNTPPGEQKFVGTPDYLAPETILGLRGDDASVDWWALGVITYEFLYGIPPYHADSPERVFENILSGRIDWHEDWVEFSHEARDFMERLMTISVPRRLGANGSDEVKEHAFFEDIEWDKVTATEAAFIPQVTDPESTDYFDPRGAIPQLFHDDDDHVAITNRALDSPSTDVSSTSAPAAPVPISGHKDHTSSNTSSDDFGSFSFKNIPVLKQANDDVIRKLKTDQMAPLTQTLSEPMSLHQRKRSMSQRIKKPPNVVTSTDGSKTFSTGPPSPATSTSSVASSPSRGSIPPSTPGTSASHSRKPSELGAVERFKINHMEPDRRNSLPSPSRLRTASVSSTGDGSGSENWGSSVGHGSNQQETPSSSVLSVDLRKGPDLNDRVVTCLLAEDNPITAKIIETLLIRLGCRCVVVADGSEAISVAMGDIKFDCILMDLQMPVLDGESAAKYIRSTNGKNSSTPIISVSAYSAEGFEANSIFAAALSKPLQKADLLTVMQKLGFKTSTIQGPRASKVTTARVVS